MMKKNLLAFLYWSIFLLSSFFAQAQVRPFVTTWNTASDSVTISIPLNNSFTYDFEYVWKNATDSSEVTFGTHTSSDGAFETELITAGDYLLEITGDFPHFSLYPAARLVDVNQWGDIVWRSMFQSFRNWPGVAFSAIDNPDLSQVTNMSQMFFRAGSFNDDISDWDVSNVTNMDVMFREARDFNQSLDSWNVSSVTRMNIMFENADDFDQDLNSWDVSKVTGMDRMFNGADNFNGDISSWNVGNVTNMNQMFNSSFNFNQDIGSWNVAKVKKMSRMFLNAVDFNQDIGDWNVSSVTNMSEMFRGARNFNQDIGSWNVENVTNMSLMFRGQNSGNPTTFNQDISQWDVRKVTTMGDMFLDSRFNQDISSWTIEATVNMSRMFFRASAFNQDLSAWDVDGVQNMRQMFRGATAFNQNLGAWDISSVTNMEEMFNSTSLSPQNYDQTLIGWAPKVNGTTPTINLGAEGLTFCKAEAARDSLIANGWTITDSGTKVCLDETDITAFTIPDLQATSEIINTTDHTVDLSVIFSANITELSPQINLSPGATVTPSADDTLDFTNPVVFTVLAEDTVASQDWTVTITQETVALTETDILSFSLAEDVPEHQNIVSIDFDSTNHIITLNLVPFGSLTNIIPEITLSQGASISPVSGDTIDMSTGTFDYLVAAEDGSTTETWTVDTEILPSKETDIVNFTVEGQIGTSDIDLFRHEITFIYPTVLGITALEPAITISDSASVSPESGVAQDFTDTVTYTVTAQDDTTVQEWSVILIPASEENDILSFNIPIGTPGVDQVNDVEIDEIDHRITINLIPFGSLTNITPAITVSDGASVNPQSGDEVDITTDSVFTVTAEDGITQQDWTVEINILPSQATDIISFSLPGQVAESFIDTENFTVLVNFPEGTDLTSLSPTFAISQGAVSLPASGVDQDFSSDVIYNITAQDGITSEDWTVIARIQRPFITSWSSDGGDLSIGLNTDFNYNFNYTWKNANEQIIAFGQHDNDDGDFITNLPAGEFTLEILGRFPHFTGYPKVQLLDVTQWGDITWESLRESFRNWTGEVFNATDIPDLSQGPDMFRAFSDNPNFNANLSDWDMSEITTLQGLFNTCPNFNSDISGWNVGKVTNMESMFNNSGFNGDISGWNTSNVTRMVNMFQNASNFDQDLSEWDISNVRSMNNMLTGAGLSIQNYDKLLISMANQSVENDVNFGANTLRSCVGTAAKNQLINNNDWTITDLGEFCSSENDILTFTISEIQIGDAIIDTIAHTASVTVLSSADLTALSPEITVSEGASLFPASDEAQNFSTPVIYTVLSSDSTVQTWEVTVANAVLPLSENDILSFDPQSDQFSEVIIDSVDHSITLRLIEEGTVQTIAPAFVLSPGATSNPERGASIDLSTGSANYTIAAEDGTEQVWTISVILNGNTDILAFDLTGVLSSDQIDTSTHTINILVPEGTSVSNVLTNITIPIGASISPAAVALQDFSSPVTYTLTAADGNMEQTWEVSVAFTRPFITTWRPELEDDDDEDLTLLSLTTNEEIEFSIGLDNEFDFDFSYQWKDTNGQIFESGAVQTSDGSFTTTFPGSNEYTLEIIGDFPEFANYRTSSLLDVNQWGEIVWRSFRSSFSDWRGVSFSATDIPDLSQVTDMSFMFNNTPSFNGDLSQWDVSNVSFMTDMFDNARAFNGDISDWNVGNVVDMDEMFRSAISFSGDIGRWDVSRVKDMAQMFEGATVFNSNIGNWAVDSVTNMNDMFQNARAFNQDIGDWNVSSVTDMDEMFEDARAFDQDLGDWDVSNVIDFIDIFDRSGISTVNYDALLKGWSQLTLRNNEPIDVGGLTYCRAAVERDAIITNFGWDFRGDNELCSSENDILAFTIPGIQVSDELIDTTLHTVTVTVLNTADITALKPQITISNGAAVRPDSIASATTLDFTEPIVYQVISSDSTVQDWEVTVTNAATASNETDIGSFDPDANDGDFIFEDLIIDSVAHEIRFVAALTGSLSAQPEFLISPGASVSPESGAVIDLSDGTATYEVTAEDGTVQPWTVIVTDGTPVNDLCSNAIALNVGDVVIGNSTFASSDANIAPNCASNESGLGVWYKIIGNGETITLNTCTGDDDFFDDTSLSVFTGSCDGGLTCLAGNEDAEIPGECGGAGFQARLQFNSEIGVEYLILVDGFSTSTGEFRLTVTSEQVETPTNDNCDEAELLTVLPEGEQNPTNGNTTNAAAFTGEVSCVSFGTVNDVWFRFNSGTNQTVRINMALVDTDSTGPLNAAQSIRLAAYTACGSNSFICDTDAEGLTSLEVTPNTDYLLQVWNATILQEGTFTIQVNDRKEI